MSMQEQQQLLRPTHARVAVDPRQTPPVRPPIPKTLTPSPGIRATLDAPSWRHPQRKGACGLGNVDTAHPITASGGVKHGDRARDTPLSAGKILGTVPPPSNEIITGQESLGTSARNQSHIRKMSTATLGRESSGRKSFGDLCGTPGGFRALMASRVWVCVSVRRPARAARLRLVRAFLYLSIYLHRHFNHPRVWPEAGVRSG